ncbi:tetratricopeptide repeat protein [Litorimonas haliclonae]|uniref:tetratricopeptide repeat protein n=1 Tax=Litorimonas haliclonae TaxID=2081977 RepID=UPI0039F0887D
MNYEDYVSDKEFLYDRVKNNYKSYPLLKELVALIRNCRKGDNRDLYRDVFPFVQEWSSLNGKNNPLPNSVEVGFNKLKNSLTQVQNGAAPGYIPPLLAWLWYRHEQHAKRFYDKHKIQHHPYIGHPDLSECPLEIADNFEYRSGSPSVETSSTQMLDKPATTDAEKEGIKNITISEGEKESKRSWQKYILLVSIVIATIIFILLLRGFESFQSHQVVERSESKGASSPVASAWGEISKTDWSNKHLKYFYKYIQSSDQSALLSAAENGNSNAMTLYAIGKHSGLILPRDHGVELSQFLRPACEDGHGRACSLIGVHYRRGWGVKKSDEQAVTYFDKSCTLGNGLGCNYLGSRYLMGEGVPQDIEKALAIFKEQCGLDTSSSCSNLAWFFYKSGLVSRDLEKAQHYYNRYCDIILPERCNSIETAFRDQ